MPTAKTAPQRHISQAALVDLLAGANTQPVSLVTRTSPRMRKRHNPFSYVVCVTERLGMIGANYERAVNRQRWREQQPTTRDGDVEPFKAQSLWRGAGEHVPNNRHLVRHKKTGKLYLIFFPRTNRKGEIIPDRKRYHNAVTMAEIPVDRLRPFLYPPARSVKQGTDKPIHWRLIGLDSLIAIKMAGVTYHIARPEEAETDALKAAA